MTEIKIEKKRAVWPWILLGLAVIALLIYLLFAYSKEDDVVAESAVSTELINVRENNSTVAAFVSFVSDSSNSNEMRLDHSYTNQALLKLTEAIDALAAETGYNVKADLDKAQEYADKITNDPFETTHANNIRKATDILSTCLQNIQQAKYPGLEPEADQLKVASASINPDVLTLQQKDEVKAFFNRAASLLDKMN